MEGHQLNDISVSLPYPFREKRGFALMSPEKRSQIARKGGIAAHEKGRAHEWNATTASLAGKKGGSALRLGKCVACGLRLTYYKIKYCSDRCGRKKQILQ